MEKVRGADRAIVLGLVGLLLALLGLSVSNRSGPAHAALPTGPTPATAAPLPTGTASGGAVAASSTPSSSTSSATTSTTAPSAPPAGPVSAVGDSLMLDIAPYLQADLPGVRVDGMVSRQFETGIGVVGDDRAAGTLGRVVIIELGTNGTVTSGDVDAMMQAASGAARVVFVNVDVPRPWTAGDNAVLAAGVARYPGVAVLVDWFTLASAHPEWFTADQVHLQPAGAQAMAALIAAVA